MKKLLLIGLLITATGCASFSKTAIISTKKVHLDPRVLEQCVDLPLLPSPATWQDVLTNHSDVVELYADCRTKQAVSVKLLQEFANGEVVK